MAAYKKVKKKKVQGQQSYYVKAKAYTQGAKKVNTRKVDDFADKIPFNIEVYATSEYVKFTEYIGDDDERTTGAMVTFTYDGKMKDPTSYNQQYKIAENWVYGSPAKK